MGNNLIKEERRWKKKINYQEGMMIKLSWHIFFTLIGLTKMMLLFLSFCPFPSVSPLYGIKVSGCGLQAFLSLCVCMYLQYICLSVFWCLVLYVCMSFFTIKGSAICKWTYSSCLKCLCDISFSVSMFILALFKGGLL